MRNFEAAGRKPSGKAPPCGSRRYATRRHRAARAATLQGVGEAPAFEAAGAQALRSNLTGGLAPYRFKERASLTRIYLIPREVLCSLSTTEKVYLQETSTRMSEATSNQPFQIERRGEIAIIIPAPEVEKMHEPMIKPAAQLIIDSLKEDPPSALIFDLSQVDFVGSMFLSLLLHCHKRVKEHDAGTEVVVAGPSKKARELLHITALDTIWPLYDSRAEAVAGLTVD